ncbi:MAG TPA: MFS transporter [Acidimicrobiia bacterium]|nr:MFS transporter [Acidimicrobiia bacterium]
MNAAAGMTSRQRWALVGIVVAATMVSQAFGRFAYALVLPSVQRDLEISYTLAGFLGTLNLAAYLISAFGVAWLSTRIAPDRIMRTGIGICVAGLAAMWWSPNLGVVIAGMVVTGAAGASIWIPAPAVSSSLVPPERRALAIGTIGTGIGIGFVSAGWVARVVGDDWRAVYRFETIVALATAVVLWIFLRVPTEAEARPPSLRALSLVPDWRLVFATYGGFGLSMSLFVNYFVARLEEDSGYLPATSALVFALFGVASIFGGPLYGAVSDRTGRRAALIAGFLSMAVASVTLLLGFGIWPWLAAVIFGLAFAGVPTATAAYLRDHLSAREFGSAFGVITLAFGAGQLLGPQIGGYLGDALGSFAAVFHLAAVVAVAAGFGVSRLGRSAAASPG